MKTFILLFLILFGIDSFAVCDTTISRVNFAANAVLTSTELNDQLNTAYTRVNELPGDCVTDNTLNGSKLENLSVEEGKLSADVTAKFLPSGAILPYTGATAPTGFLLCDGSAVSRTTYSDLYAVIGDKFGNGDGSTTFTLPDFQGKFLRGWDDSAGNDPDAGSRTTCASGGNSGDNIGSCQDHELDSHSHTVNMATSGSGGSSKPPIDPSSSGTNNYATSSTGGNETRPLNVTVNYIIKI